MSVLCVRAYRSFRSAACSMQKAASCSSPMKNICAKMPYVGCGIRNLWSIPKFHHTASVIGEVARITWRGCSNHAGGVAEISESKGVHRSMDVVHIRSPVLNRFFAASIKNGHIKVTAKKRKSNLPNEEEHSATQAANENKTEDNNAVNPAKVRKLKDFDVIDRFWPIIVLRKELGNEIVIIKFLMPTAEDMTTGTSLPSLLVEIQHPGNRALFIRYDFLEAYQRSYTDQFPMEIKSVVLTNWEEKTCKLYGDDECTMFEKVLEGIGIDDDFLDEIHRFTKTLINDLGVVGNAAVIAEARPSGFYLHTTIF